MFSRWRFEEPFEQAFEDNQKIAMLSLAYIDSRMENPFFSQAGREALLQTMYFFRHSEAGESQV